MDAAPNTPPWLSGHTPEDPKVEEAKGSKVQQDPLTGRFMKGSGGRPKGSRNRVTVAAELLMEREAEAITRTCIELALKGDPTALKIVMDRVCPVRRGRALPDIRRRANEGSVDALLRAVLEGEITPTEGHEVVSLIESAARVAAVQALADMRREQLEAVNRVRETGAGVMVVPMAGMDEWESIAVETQRQLKARQRE